MTNVGGTTALDERPALLDQVARAPDAAELFAETSTWLRRLIPFDAAVLGATDPATGLMTAPVRVENLDEDGCAAYWDTELLAERVNTYRDLARADVPAAGLRTSTGDRHDHSALYRSYLRPRGFDDELRAVLRIGTRTHGQFSLFRARGRPAFTRSEIEFVAGLCTPLAQRLRSYAALSATPDTGSARGPGLLLFDVTGVLVSINDDARAYLADMPPGPGTPTPLGISLPAWIHSTAIHARRLAEGSSRIRIRTANGRWLLCHASCLRAADGTLGQTAMVIEAATASDVLPLLVEAYELSGREWEITQCIARGLSTREIAALLFISPHTVRDHIKVVFTKVGVSSRGELVARLFTEFYEPRGARGLIRVER